MSDIVLNLENISKSFFGGAGEIHVLSGINIAIKRGESLAITGPSGAGKSTLIHIMGGLECPTSGAVLFEGKDVYSMDKNDLDRYRNSKVGFVFQFHYLLDDFSAVENVMIPALLAGESAGAAKKRAEEILKHTGLSSRLSHYPKELSGGEQQRVALARALMNSPSVILADEPTGSLDRQNSDMIRNLLFSFTDMGTSLVIVTHDTELAGRAKHNIHLEKG